MAATRIYYSITKRPIISTPIFIWLNWELYRVHTGTQPYISPRISAWKEHIERESNSGSLNDSSSDRKSGQQQKKKEETTSSGWDSLNGIPIPRFEYISSMFRKD